MRVHPSAATWHRRLRAGRMSRVRDVGYIGLWLLALAVALLLARAVDLPDWPRQVALLGTGLQTLGVLSGLVLTDPTPQDWADRKFH